MRDASPVNRATSEDRGGERPPYVIASALRTLHVLHAFTAPPHRMGLADVVECLGLERNQAYRSLKTLEAAGFLVQADDARFEPGPAAVTLATTSVRFHSAAVIDVAGPFLDRLAGATHETVHLFVLSGDRAVCVDRRESPQSVRLVSIVGRSQPLYAGAAPKAILAWLGASERAAVIERLGQQPAQTARSPIEPASLDAELVRIRERGYSVSDGDVDDAARGVGAAILGPDGSVAGGISVGGPSFRIDDATISRFADLVREAAAEIAHTLALASRS